MRTQRIATTVLALVLALALAPSGAQAAPITLVHTVLSDSAGNLVPGTITASFDLYRAPWDDPTSLTLVDEFSLGIGSDFSVAVPQTAIDARTSWEATFPSDPGSSAPGMNRVAIFASARDVEHIRELCTVPSFSLEGRFVTALRGNCTFAQKASVIESIGGAGTLIVNNIPGAGAPSMTLGTFDPTGAVIGLSHERAAQMISLYPAIPLELVLYVDFSARWDPDPSPVPEPATLALFSGGLAMLAARRRSRHRRGSSEF